MRTPTLVAAVAIAAGLISAPTVVDAPARAATPSQVVAALDGLDVKGRAPRTGYDRALFGQAWTDDVNVDGGHNGCDTRNDVLRRDLRGVTLRPGSHGCTVLTGTLADPYTGQTIEFERGPRSSVVQIDHVVALADAWQKGAQQWSSRKRIDFANDPLNLLAVSGTANQAKGAGDAATWLPRNKSFRCDYVARQVAVKQKYGAWTTAAEKSAMQRVLSGCTAVSLPAAAFTGRYTEPDERRPAAPRQDRARPAPVRPQQQPEARYYKNCSEARAAGAAPIHRGQPGYGSHLDRDNDGIACE